MDPKIEAQLAPLLRDLDAGFGSGYSAIVFGSAARSDFVPGHSDINLMLVMPVLDAAALRRLSAGFSRWRKTGHPPPLLLTPAELARSADAFPLEIHDLKASHVVVRGVDPLAGLMVRPADLRVALERDARGKLLRLRQGYAEANGKTDRVTQLARLTVGGVLLLCRAVLGLARRPVPADPVAMIGDVAGLAGFPPAALAELAARRGEGSWRCTPERFEAYLATVERLVGFLDELHTGDE